MERTALAQLNCPRAVTWAADVSRLFTSMDVDHMKKKTMGALDLSDYESVKIWAAKIYDEVSSGHMPPPYSGEGEWSADMKMTFACWMQQGCPQ